MGRKIKEGLFLEMPLKPQRRYRKPLNYWKWVSHFPLVINFISKTLWTYNRTIKNLFTILDVPFLTRLVCNLRERDGINAWTLPTFYKTRTKAQNMKLSLVKMAILVTLVFVRIISLSSSTMRTFNGIFPWIGN